MWEALYSPSTGLAAFRCKLPNEAKDGECGRVTRTLRGIKSHALKVHGARQQEALLPELRERSKAELRASFPGGV